MMRRQDENLEPQNNPNEGNNGKIITISIILAEVGVAFMSRLPQYIPGQQAIPWYQSGFFWAGIVIVLIALLVLIVPLKTWRCIWQFILGFPRWLHESYIWHKYGPECTLEIPEIKYELAQNGGIRAYTTKVFLTIVVHEKTKVYLPVRCSFRDMEFQLRQKRGMIPLVAILERNLLLGTESVINAPGKTTYWMGLSWMPFNNPALQFVDTQKPYQWIIKNVIINLDSLLKPRILSRKGRSNGESSKAE